MSFTALRSPRFQNVLINPAPLGNVYSLAGQSDGVSSVSGSITLTHVTYLLGSSAGTSTAQASVARNRLEAGSSAGSSTATGTLAVTYSLSGSTSGGSNTSASPTRTSLLSGSLVATSATTGTLTVVSAIESLLSGSSDGTSTASGTLERSALLSASVAGSSTADQHDITEGTFGSGMFGDGFIGGALSPGLLRDSEVSSTLVATSSASGTITVEVSGVEKLLVGSSAGISTVIGTSVRTHLGGLASISTGISTVTGVISRTRELYGNSTGTSTTIADASKVHYVELSGSSVSSSTVYQHDLSSIPIWLSYPGLTRMRKLYGTIAGTSTAVAAITKLHRAPKKHPVGAIVDVGPSVIITRISATATQAQRPTATVHREPVFSVTNERPL